MQLNATTVDNLLKITITGKPREISNKLVREFAHIPTERLERDRERLVLWFARNNMSVRAKVQAVLFKLF